MMLHEFSPPRRGVLQKASGFLHFFRSEQRTEPRSFGGQPSRLPMLALFHRLMLESHRLLKRDVDERLRKI